MLARLSHREPWRVWATLLWLGAVAASWGCHRTFVVRVRWRGVDPPRARPASRHPWNSGSTTRGITAQAGTPLGCFHRLYTDSYQVARDSCRSGSWVADTPGRGLTGELPSGGAWVSPPKAPARWHSRRGPSRSRPPPPVPARAAAGTGGHRRAPPPSRS